MIAFNWRYDEGCQYDPFHDNRSLNPAAVRLSKRAPVLTLELHLAGEHADMDPAELKHRIERAIRREVSDEENYCGEQPHA